jgi:glycosyltransferase involved in cell wall biosynthesis
MRIAITVDPYLPVPPLLYGGIERVVDFLVRGLAERGHDVTLLAHPDSQVGGKLIPYGAPPHFNLKSRLVELWQVGSALWGGRNDFEVIHSFGRLASLLPVLPIRRLRKIQSYQRDAIPWGSVKTAVRLAGDSICFTACSSSVFREQPQQGEYGGNWHAVFNGVEVGKYDLVPQVASDAPLVFLGRLEPIKGAHNAIVIAKQAGRRLIIAGNQVQTGPDADYFDLRIAPHIDGNRVCYVGPVDDVQKNKLLGSAAAFLMPIEWDEPFGIVMAEALACGTPVIAFSRGSVPEVVLDGTNGYSCRTIDDAVTAVGKLDRIDRAAVRLDCERRFSATVIVDAYESLYKEGASADAHTCFKL